MKILKIELINKTEKEDYTLITFKKWYGKPFTKTCLTKHDSIRTRYADTGKPIPVQFWHVVKAFIRAGNKFHEY